MTLQGRIPIEPLDDERLTNIERKLVVAVSELRAEPAARLPRYLALAGAVTAVAVAGIVGYKIRGDGALPADGEHAVIAMKDSTLDLGDAEVTSTPGTGVTIVRERGKTTVEMAIGRIDLHVDHDPARLFVVRAGDTEIEDIGTRFSVAYDGTRVEVRVTEGEVKVKRAGRDAHLTVNEAWTTEDGETTIAALDARAAASGSGAAVATGPHDGRAAPGAPSDGSGPAPDSAPDVVAMGSGSAVPAGDSARGSGSPRPRPGRSNARKALDKLPYEAPEDAGGATEPRAAIAVYLERIKGMSSGDDKSRLLYSIAVMEHRAKDNAGAKRTIEGLLRRQGGHAAEFKAAMWLDVRIKCLEAFDDECRRTAQRYLGRFPDGPAAGVAQTILAEIASQ